MKANAAALTLLLIVLLAMALAPASLAQEGGQTSTSKPKEPPLSPQSPLFVEPENSRPRPLAPTLGGPYGGPADYDSGWVELDPGAWQVFEHNLGGNPDDYVVDLYARPGAFIYESPMTQAGIGSDHYWDGDLVFRGYFWHSLNANSVTVYRQADDDWANLVRLRIWVAPDSDYDSDWQEINPDQNLVLDHELGGAVDDYVVNLQFRDLEDWGVTNAKYGIDSYNWDGADFFQNGAAWHHLTDSSVQVIRAAGDTYADQVRLRIWRAPDPDFETPWREVDAGDYLVMNHNLGGPWNDLVVDVQFWQEAEFGVHQVFYGGDTFYDGGERIEIGAALQWLNGSRLVVHIGEDDSTVEMVRARAWANPRPKYDSGWTPIDPGTDETFDHNLGGDVADYYVDLQFADTVYEGGTAGVNQIDFGGDTWDPPDGDVQRTGALWRGLTENRITVTRMPEDETADEVRVRIWIAPPADYDAWMATDPDQTKVFEHLLGGDPDDYVVDVQAHSHGDGWSQAFFGQNLEADDWIEGFEWRNLTEDQIEVATAPQSGIDELRVRIWWNPEPDYDSDWLAMEPAFTETLWHNLGGDPDLYIVNQAHFDVEDFGMNSAAYGSDLAYRDGPGWAVEGAVWYGLDSDRMAVWREEFDSVADGARFRIWFTGDCYALDARVEPAQGGVIEPNLEPNCERGYHEGSAVVLEAVPNQGFKFFRWTGDNWASYGSRYHWQDMYADQEVIAEFLDEDTCFTVTVDVEPAGSGTVTVDPAPNCASGPGYEPGTELTLAADEGQGYEFTQWDGGYWTSENNPLTTILADDEQITARFAGEGACYTLTTDVNPAGSGTVTADPSPDCNGGMGYSPGTLVTLTPEENEGYAFGHWSGDATGDDDPLALAMNGDRDVTAHFDSDQTCYPLATAVAPPGSGTIQRQPAPNCGGEYLAGTSVTLTAVPEKGQTFDTWSGDAGGSGNPAHVTMDEAKYVQANFRIVPRKVLFDESHGERNTIDWDRAKELENILPWHPAPEWVYFGKLRDDLAAEFPLERLWDAPITPALLKDYYAVILSAPEEALDEDEQRALLQFVQAGGGLILLGDCGLSHQDNDVWWAAYDLAFDNSCLWAPIPEENGNFEIDDYADHPAVPWYATLAMEWGQSLTTRAPAEELAWTAANTWTDTNGDGEYSPGEDEEGPFPVIAVHDGGCGRVAAVSDNSFHDGDYEARGNTPLIFTLLRWATGGEACGVAYEVYVPLVSR